MGSKNNYRKEHGFSLVEVSIALVIISMIMVPLFSYFKAKTEQKQITDTNTKLANIENAINQFFFASNARYPCPASLIVNEGNNLNGEEFATCPSLGTIRLCSDAAWRTNEGLCKTSTDPDEAVIIGAVPFNRISLTPKDSLDVWGNRIIYAVTYRQTETANFNMNSGQIEVMAYEGDPPTPQDVTDTSDMTDFLTFSTGMAGIGGFSKDGIPVGEACNTAGNITESENCDFDDVFFLDVNPEDPLMGSRGFSNNNVYYDDITRVQNSVPQAIWFPHPTNTHHVITMSARIGIGVDTPQQTLDVDGDIRANRSLKSDQLCLSADTSQCFEVQFITQAHQCIGDTSSGVVLMNENSLKCGSGVYENGSATSGSSFAFGDDFNATSCPYPQVQQGFDASGDPICVTN